MTPPAIQSFVNAARQYVQRTLGTELDGSETSLAFVDHYIERVARGPDGLKDEVLALVAPALGAYFGEVAIAKLGGHWVIEREDDPASFKVELEPVDLRFYPVALAATALRGADVDGYDASLTTRPELEGPLSEALAASPPVDEAYFYSLTGRIEVIEQAVEILAELERQKREPRP